MIQTDSPSQEREPKKRDVLAQFCGETQAVREATHRRGFLHQSLALLGGAFTSVLGLSDSGVAQKQWKKDKAKSAASEYGSQDRVRKAVSTHATELIEALANQGYLTESSVEALPIENFFTRLKPYTEADEGVFVFGTVSNGEPRTKIQFKKSTSDGQELRIIISPQEERSSAILVEELITGFHVTSLTTTETSSEEVTTQSCDCMDYSTKCRVYCNGVGSCSCAEFTIGDYCTDDTGGDCTYCTIDYSDCSSCSDTYSCS